MIVQENKRKAKTQIKLYIWKKTHTAVCSGILAKQDITTTPMRAVTKKKRKVLNINKKNWVTYKKIYIFLIFMDNLKYEINL